MNEINRKLQREAERIAAKRPLPEFYSRFRAPIALARKLYFQNPLVLLLRERVEPMLREDMGHGLYHSSRVSIDSAALMLIESQTEGLGRDQSEKLMVLSILAGLLHDICREQENHAEAGAMEAEKILGEFPVSDQETSCILRAIRNHEAFVTPTPCKLPELKLLSDCLYDADKFRWGVDTFIHTLWHMADHQGLSPLDLIQRFPWGMTGIYRIIDTFRTPTGRQYGPEIIESGVEVGKEIYRYLLSRFREPTHAE